MTSRKAPPPPPAENSAGWHCWYREDRYYAVSFGVDLFGEPVVVVAHGGRHTRIARTTTSPLQGRRQADVLTAIHARRIAHRYLPA